MTELRLGDIIDDHCIKCRRLTNHAIVSIVNNAVAKVRCRSCYHDHDYRHEIAPPSKKDLKKAELAAAAAAAKADGTESDLPFDPDEPELSLEAEEPAPVPVEEAGDTDKKLPARVKKS